MTKKKKKIKLGSIYIFINIIFILGCFIFYGYRLIHFYRLEHPKIEENTPLYELITLDKNITTINEGLYKEDNVYRYIGNNLDNYVIYSGRLWRIVSAEDNKVKLITEDPQTSLVWSINTNYENSYVRSWLNDENNELKSFYESLSNTSYIVNTKTCIDVVSEDSLKCEQVIEDKVGLLSAYEYQKAGGEESYLNIGEYWWTSNTDKDNVAWYVYSKGSLNNTSYSGTTYYSYGVRPTITLNGDIEVIRGNGTKETPYLLDKTTENILNKKYVGEYLNYSGYTWRIIETDDEYVKIAMNGIVKNDDGEDLITYFGKSNYYSVSQDVGKYLNTTFYNNLQKRLEKVRNIIYNNSRDEFFSKQGGCFMNSEKQFPVREDEVADARAVLKEVYEALSEKGYNPINQIVGYILSEDPTYITTYNNARNIIRHIDRDELLQVLVRSYLNT